MTLDALVEAGHEVAVVVSQPDRRRGRGAAAAASPVKARAVELGLDVADDVESVLGRGVELGVVVAFGQLVPGRVLAEVPMVNLHYSLLPRWRGAAPVERAILAGDELTGVCLMALEEGLDTGGVYRRQEVAIGAEETAAELVGHLTVLGTAMLVEALDAGLGPALPQSGPATYARKLTPEDRRINWHADSESICRVVRIGGAWTTFRGRRLGIRAARVADPGREVGSGDDSARPGEIASSGALVATGGGVVELAEVAPEGKAAMAATAWLNGARPRPGEVLGS